MHTQKVLDQFESQTQFYALGEMEKKYPRLGDLKILLRATIVLHDIGKSLGDTRDQHVFTIPILEHYLYQWGFNSEQVELGKEIVNHDLLGELLKGGIGLGGLPTILHAKAKKLKMATKDFFDLQKLFYISDASSYPSLRSSLFESNEQGQLRINAADQKLNFSFRGDSPIQNWQELLLKMRD